MELFEASRQWATRPQDERFWSPVDMFDAMAEVKARTVLADVLSTDLRVEAHGDDIAMIGDESKRALFSNHAFGQFCRFAGAPAAYLRKKDPDMAVKCLNDDLFLSLIHI